MHILSKLIKRFLQQIRVSLGIVEMKNDLSVMKAVAIEQYITTELRENVRYSNSKRLNQHEFQIYSQFGEDGIIQEIFKRIGTTNNYFVEIGSADGMENNTTHLLTNGWEGVWIEGDEKLIASATTCFSLFIISKKLRVEQAYVTRKNVITIFRSKNVPKEFDFLSIDIDGNDYWIWQALSRCKPRVICIEYNASLGSKAEWVIEYSEDHRYDNTNYFGASLKSLELLGKQAGYTLVGCSFAGTNAFFVRSDLTRNNFLTPSTAENLYEPSRYFLYRRSGHKKNFQIFKDFIVKSK